MKAVILAGGFGTRISEESSIKPKPMVEIGGMPILWHIMKIYSAYGINDFIICLGYKGYVIKEYFSNYFLHMSDVTFDIKNNAVLTACLVYLASEQPEMVSREKRVMPPNRRTGEPRPWPEMREPNRNGGE